MGVWIGGDAIRKPVGDGDPKEDVETTWASTPFEVTPGHLQDSGCLAILHSPIRIDQRVRPLV